MLIYGRKIVVAKAKITLLASATLVFLSRLIVFDLATKMLDLVRRFKVAACSAFIQVQ